MASMVKPEVKLKAILEIARNLSTELKIDTVAPKILDSLDGAFPAGRAPLPGARRPRNQAARSARPSSTGPPRRSIFSTVIPADEIPMSISRSIVNHVLGQKKAVLSQDAGADKNLPTSASIADLKIRSVMCVPLLTPDREALGILQLDTSDRKQFAPGRPGRPGRGGQPGGHRDPERADARVAARTRASEPRPEARRAGPEAVPAAVGPGDPRLRVLRPLRPGLRGRRRLLRLRSAARTTGWPSPWATSPARGSPPRS